MIIDLRSNESACSDALRRSPCQLRRPGQELIRDRKSAASQTTSKNLARILDLLTSRLAIVLLQV